MRPRPVVKTLTLLSLGVILSALPASAEDTKGKWQFGFGLSYMSTRDYIRSNADVSFAGDPIGDNGLPGVTFVDPRPDANLQNQPSIQDDFKLDLHASYGLTRWLAVEFGVGHLKAPVGNIEFYNEDVQVILGAGQAPSPAIMACGPAQADLCYGFDDPNDPVRTKTNTFVPLGTLTEVPIQVSALVRFRPESPLDPYIGLGAGYIFTDFKGSRELAAHSSEVTSLQVGKAWEGEVNKGGVPQKDVVSPGFTPGPITVEVRNAREFHAVGGVDYYVNERFSFYVDARYVWTGGNVDVRTDGAHQVFLTANDFGRLVRRTNPEDPSQSMNLWEDLSFAGCVLPDGKSCSGDKLFETMDGNGNGTLDSGVGEGVRDADGKITVYVFKVGPGSSPSRIPRQYTCPPGTAGCPEGGTLAPEFVGTTKCSGCSETSFTEDRNGNGLMDRFLYYGLDICTTDEGRGTPQCSRASGDNYHLWPEGCTQQRPSSPSDLGEGCPIPAGTTLKNSGIDNVNDVYVIQGGKINLGGFSLGLGIKFTF